ncbi:hypothetical protein TCSYLVIO_001860 [Trypanosoma cruzi]|uniref:TLDc domain-containing protein n=1 Tax=Trypanosoma cruzi Dm28c TaxID=1416333 RepID=V5BXU1_TRYCR|nr:hypothetical protein TCSYLVIO_001860 [Trypanosoma cruzi]ESS69378.1 hypothetical protein TCDM_01887 [Trypanosoma cruzi Dm28c]
MAQCAHLWGSVEGEGPRKKNTTQNEKGGAHPPRWWGVGEVFPGEELYQMGGLFTRFIPFMYFDGNDDAEGMQATPPPPFDVSVALEEVPPDVYLKRETAIKPSIPITGKQFLTLQEHVPPRFQGRRWRLLFCSGLHGFSRLALQHNCAEEIRSARGNERPAVLIVSAGSEGKILLGAYISCIPQTSNKKYVGTEESFLFCVPPPSSSSSSALSSSDDLFIFTAPADAANRYFMRCDNGAISFGGGGKGPALFLHSDFASVSCSTFCPTFGIRESLLLLNARPGGDGDAAVFDLPNDVHLEGGEPTTSVRAVQLWTIGDEYFSLL